MSYRGRKAGGKSSNPFERMMQEQCNKPVAAKSAGIVGKWGATSFTSVRATGEKTSAGPRPKKFFKSRAENSENSTETHSDNSENPKKRTEREGEVRKVVRKEKESRARDPVPAERKERSAWSSSSNPRPPLERSPLHPSRSPLNPSPSSNPSTTPPRSRSHSNKRDDPLSKENKQQVDRKVDRTEQPKSAKDQMFDTLVSGSRNKEDRKKRKQEEEGGGPRIKLKISVNRSPDKADNTYKVVRKEDDLLSVCSQSSTGSEPASSEAGSDRTDVSNGFAHKYKDVRSNLYYQDQVSAKSSAPTPAASASRSAALPSQSATETITVEKPVSSQVPEQLTRLRTGKPSRSRDKAVLDLQPAPVAHKPARSKSPAVPSPPPTQNAAETAAPEKPATVTKRRLRGGTSSKESSPDTQSESAQEAATAVSKAATVAPPDVPQTAKRRLPRGAAVKEQLPSVDAAETVLKPETVVTVAAVKVEKAAPAVPAPTQTRKFFTSKNSTSSAAAASSQQNSVAKTESKKLEVFKSEPSDNKTDVDFDSKKVKSEPLVKAATDKPAASQSSVVKPTTSAGGRSAAAAKPAPSSSSSARSTAARTAVPSPQPPRSPSPEFSLELPKLPGALEDDSSAAVKEEAVSKPAPPRKKKFFTNRNREGRTGAGSLAAPPKKEDTARKVEAAKEPPRVPPVSEHFVQVSSTESTSNSQVSKILSSVQSPPRSFRSLRNKEPPAPAAPSEPAEPDPEEISSSQDTLPPPEDEFKAPLVGVSDVGGSKSGSSKPAKKTFFTSKKKTAGAGLQAKAMSLYKHNVGWNGGEFNKQQQNNKNAASLAMFDEDDFSDEETSASSSSNVGDISLAPSKITRVATYPMTETNTDEDGDLVTQVKCPKSYKPLFTVIKNVKKAHEINDYGEDQEFQDDVEYIVDGLNPKHRIPLRCLTAISLASKCMKPNFRMHLRAHSVVSKFFSELQDAPANASLALCTATVMFVLSQDRLNMDLDRDSLKLMLNLLDTDSKISSALEDSGLDKKELEKNKQKVIDICAEMKKMGHATSLNLDLISADHLSMETLLSMTSQRSGEWFKEELRELGGIGHLARTVSDCINYLTIKSIESWTEILKDKLKKANRILRVLENVSHENEENCTYLLEYKIDNQEFILILQKLFNLLDTEVQLNPSTDLSDKDSIAVVVREALFSLVRVHINLAYDYNLNAQGSLILGRQEGMIARALRCLFIIPFWFVPLSKRFECLILSLTLLVNLVETCQENRAKLMECMAAQKELGLCVKEEPRLAIEDLVQMYLDREELARISEQKTDNILDDVEEEVQEIDPKESDKDLRKDTLEETVQKLINKAGSHMESCIIAAYIGLVLGYLIKDSDDFECRIREYLPSKDFKTVVVVLEKLSKFMQMTSSGSSYVSKSIKGTQKIIKYLEKIDADPESEEEDKDHMEFDTSNLDISFDMTQDSINLPETTMTSDYTRTQYGSSINDFDDF